MTLEQADILRNINYNLEEIFKLLRNIAEGDIIIHTEESRKYPYTGGPG